jgi:hypothetical protein
VTLKAVERYVLALVRGGIGFCTACVGVMAVPPVVRPRWIGPGTFSWGRQNTGAVVRAPLPKTPASLASSSRPRQNSAQRL